MPTDLDALSKILVTGVISPLIYLIFSASVAIFFWGIAKYMGKMGDDKEREKAKSLMIWGIIGIFVMVSIWGWVNILSNTFPFDNTRPSPTNTISTGG